jgi:hypothetical protein
MFSAPVSLRRDVDRDGIHVFPDTRDSGRPLSVLDVAARSIDLHREIELQVSAGKSSTGKSSTGKSQQARLKSQVSTGKFQQGGLSCVTQIA